MKTRTIKRSRRVGFFLPTKKSRPNPIRVTSDNSLFLFRLSKAMQHFKHPHNGGLVTGVSVGTQKRSNNKNQPPNVFNPRCC